MTLVLIAAVAQDGGIGHEGDLLWRERADQLHFTAQTMGHPVVMGRKTWESLPARVRPLPGRRNVVVTRNAQYPAPGAEVVTSLGAALDLLRDSSEVFVCGGSALYAEALPLADRLELTEIGATFVADTFFPPWDRTAFVETRREAALGSDGTLYAFVRYERKTGDESPTPPA